MDNILFFILLLTAVVLFIMVATVGNKWFDYVWDRYIETMLERFLTKNISAFKPQSPHWRHFELEGVMRAYQAGHFDTAERLLLDLAEDCQSFAFRMLSEMGDEKITRNWLAESNSNAPKIAMAMYYINEAWSVRGGGFSDTISHKRAMGFYELLQEAKGILMTMDSSDSVFAIHRLVALITVYKGLETERELVHKTFEQGIALFPHHIGLHEAYFDAISPKWGGSDEEVSNYFQKIPSKPELLVSIIWAMYYRDVLHVNLEKDPKKIQEIRQFVLRIAAQDFEPQGLHCVTLYEYMSDIARIESYALEEMFEQLYEACF